MLPPWTTLFGGDLMPPAAYAPYIAIALCFTILTARMVFCWPARDDNRQWGMSRPAVPLTNKMKASKIFKAGPRSGESPVKFVRRVKKSFYNARNNAIRKKSGQLKEDNKISNAKTSRELIAKKEHCEIAAMAMRNKEPELTQETADAVATELYEGFLDDETGQPLFKFIVRDLGTRRIHGYAQLVYATTGQPPRVGLKA